MQEMVDRKMFLSEAMGCILFRCFWQLINDLQTIVANYQTKQIMIGCHQRWAPILQSPGLLWLVALSLWRSSSHPLGRGPGGWPGFLQRLLPRTSRPKPEEMALMARLCKPTCATARWRAWPHTRLWWRPTYLSAMSDTSEWFSSKVTWF